MAEEQALPEEYNVPTDLPGEELNARIDPVEGYLPARPEAIDSYRNVVGNPVTGSNPGAVTNAPVDFSKSLVETLNKKISNSQPDDYYKMRPYTYSGDYDAANFDRYYGTKAYKTLGFSPYRDNESLYNEKMTMGDQFVRSFGQWDNLLWTGFKSGVKTWGDIFTDPIAPDIQSAKEMQRSMAIGSINTGGAAGFIGNTALNAMYGIGIGLEFIAEEAALTAATAFSGGLLGEATAPAMLSRGAMFAKQLGKIGEFGAKVGGRSAEYAKSFEKGMAAFKKVETAADLTKNIGKTEGAIEGVNSARNFFNKAVSGAFDLVNPFEQTFNSLKSTQYASNLAKTIGTSGAFIDDIIRIKTAAAEAKLEGGMVKIDATKKLIDQYRELNGKDPEGEDLAKIERQANLEAERTVLYNYPAIMATNKLLFSTILYPLTKMKGGPTPSLIKELFTEGPAKATSQNIFKKLGTSPGAQIKAAAKSLLKPKVYGTYGMSYLKANLAEGVQENIQEAISQGAIEHALAVQKDPAMAAYQGYMGYFMKGLEDQISPQGAETFASGFLMGMFTQPIMTAPVWGLTKGIEQLRSKDTRDKIRAERDAAADAKANILNNLANNDIKYWYSDAVTAVKNNALNQDMLNQASIGDVKGARDSQFAIEFHHIAAMEDSGYFETLMDKLKDYKNLTPTEALEAFKRYNIGIETEADAEKALKHIDSVVERAYRIKDQFQEVANKFPNFYNFSGLTQGTPEHTAMAISYKSWQEAQRNLIFAKSQFDEYGRRIQGMTDAFASLSDNIAKADSQHLQSVMSMPSLKMEISTLKKEISSLGDVEAQGPIKRDKQKKLDLLQNFQESIEAAQEKIAKEGITDYTDKQAVYGQAKKDFQKYLGYLAKKNDTILFDEKADEAFAILTDNLEMRNERQGLALSVNVLNSPKGFLNLQNRIFDSLTKEATSETRLQRIRDNIGKFYMMNDENEIIQTLGKLGLKLPEDFIEQYKTALEKGEELPTPEMYIDPSTGKEIDYFSDPDKYLKADELWQAFKYWMEESRKKTPEEIAAEQKKAADAVTAMQFDDKILESYPEQLATSLKSMHKAALDSGAIAKDQTLQEYVETNPEALQEIKLYKMQMAQQTDWGSLVENAISEKELDAVMDQIDKVNAMTSDLLNAISKKRDSFKKEEEEPEDKEADIKAMSDTLKTLPFDTINKLGKLLGTKGAFKEIEDVADAVANAYYTTKNEELIKAVDAELAALEGKPKTEEKPTTTLEWKPGPIPEGNTYDLGRGRKAVYNKERGYWEFRRKDGKVIKDKKTIEKLASELSNKPGIISFWWNNLLTEEQKEKVTADINRYADLSSQAQGAVNLEDASEIFLMKELQGVKFAPSSLKGQVTDVNMKAWTKEGSLNKIDTIISEEDAATISIPLENIPNKILTLVEAYPNGIKNSDIDQRLRELNPDTELNDLKKDFINAYGLDLERVFFYKLDVVEEPPVTKTYEDFFNESSIPEKFTTIVNELKDHNILQGTLTQDFPWESNKLDEEYRYQVTLNDGRVVPVTSSYYFNKDISVDVFRNNPRVRLVLTEFNGKPAVEVRTMEPGVEDKQLTYIREKEVKPGKPITFPIYNDDLLQEPAPEDTTIEEINKNISQPTLLLAWERGYDAIYNDVPYFITKVTDKTVSLRTIDDKTITVNISDIKEVRDGKGLIKNKIDAEMAKLNQTAVKNVLTSLDDAINITTAAKNIKDNKC